MYLRVYANTKSPLIKEYIETKLLENNVPFIILMLNKYHIDSKKRDDFFIVAQMGLLKAIRTFDISKNYDFITYASVCVDNNIKMEFRNLKKEKREFLNLNYAIDEDENLEELDNIQDNNKSLLEQCVQKETHERLKYYIDKLLNDNMKLVINQTYGLNGCEKQYLNKILIKKDDDSYYSREAIRKYLNSSLEILKSAYIINNNLDKVNDILKNNLYPSESILIEKRFGLNNCKIENKDILKDKEKRVLNKIFKTLDVDYNIAKNETLKNDNSMELKK